MTSGQQLRKSASLALMLLSLIWAQAEAAVAPPAGRAPACHTHMLGRHHGSAAAATHVMPSGCCPKHGHESADTLHLGGTLPRYNPSDCCFKRELPARPRTFLVVSGYALEPGTPVAGPNLVLPPSVARWALAGSPPFTRPVSSRKTDLRI